MRPKRLTPETPSRGGKLPYAPGRLSINTDTIPGYAAYTGKVLNIPDAYSLEVTAPYHFVQQFDEDCGYRTKSILVIPLKSNRNAVIGVLQIINGQDENGRVIPFTSEDEKLMFHFAGTAAVALERAQLMRSIILRMIRLAEMRDPEETGAHVNRVASYAVELYEQWAHKRRLSQREVDRVRDTLRMAAMLHDVGKVAIADAILKKPGKLTAQEYEVMKTHTVKGAELFRDGDSDLDGAAGEVALNHHECWNGSGYPGVIVKTLDGIRMSGKRGEEIPFFGRIVSICDVYDALTSRRSYKDPWAESRALTVLEEGSGKQFDPELAAIFLSRIETMKHIQSRYPENE